MRAAPPLSVRCHGGWPWRALRVGLPTLAAAVVALWLGQWLEQSDEALRLNASLMPLWGTYGLAVAPVVVALAAGALAAALAWPMTRPQPTELAWDGQHWRVGGPAGRLAVMIDLGPWLLLRWWPEPGAAGPARWLAVWAGEVGPAWHPLRCALFARSPAQPNDHEPQTSAPRGADGRPG